MARREPAPSRLGTTKPAKRTANLDAVEGPGSKRLRTGSDENGAPIRRSERSTKGQGGALKQMQATSEAVHPNNGVKKSKSRVQNIPDNTAANPMAPAPKKPSRRSGKADRMVPVLPQGLPMPLPGTDLVPPGAEPDPNRTRFGFQPRNSANGPRPHFQERATTPQSLHHISVGRDVTDEYPTSRPQHLASLSPVPPGQQRYGIPQAASPQTHRALSDASSVRAHVTSCENNEGESDDSGVQYEDEIRSSDDAGNEEEMTQFPLGTPDEINPDNIQYGIYRDDIHDEADHLVVPNNAGDINVDDDDDAYQPLNSGIHDINSGPQDPLVPGFNRSPSEDERLAEAHLEDNSYDVLRRHHAQNRAPLPPDPQQLEKVRSHGNIADEAEQGRGPWPETESPESSPSDGEPGPRSRRHSKKAYSRLSDNPKNLRFYPAQWQYVLTKAMKKWRLWMVVSCGFPSNDNPNHRDIAKDCIMEALSEHQKDGGRVEKGFWPRYQSGMQDYIFADRSTFRQLVRAKAATAVCLFYRFKPSAEEAINNQNDEIQQVASAIHDISYKGHFLKGGYDAEGRVDNLCHPAVKEVCIEIYRLIEDSLGSLPDELEDMIPIGFVALASAAIKCCIDAWECGSFDRKHKFTTDKYRQVSVGTLVLTNELKENTYHWNKFVIARRSWAAEAKLHGCPTDGMGAGDMELFLD